MTNNNYDNDKTREEELQINDDRCTIDYFKDMITLSDNGGDKKKSIYCTEYLIESQ